MSCVVLTIFCAAQDGAAIAGALRDVLHAPVHLRREDVFGRDFGDAGTGERVTGTLARMAIEVTLPAGRVAEAIEAVSGTRRRRPFRWRTVAMLEGGRVE